MENGTWYPQDTKKPFLDAHPKSSILDLADHDALLLSILDLGIGICCSGQRPSAGANMVIQRRQKKKGKKKQNRARRKYPTYLVKAAACYLLRPLTTTTGWILRGHF